MTNISIPQLAEARRALEEPLFADLAGDVGISFEFFPPKSEKMETQLWEAIRTLEPLQPDFVSVTYGAGGSTRERTHATVARIQRETSMNAAAHLTCVEATKAEIDQVAEEYWAAGVRHIVALRGDMPTLGQPYQAHPGGYENAAALVAGLRKLHPFEISVAAYPECHPESGGHDADIDNLKRKIDAGASRAITQFFFSPEAYFRFRDRVAAAGITAQILPVSCRCRTSRRRGSSQDCAVPRSRRGWTGCSKGSTIIPRRGSSLRRRSRPRCAGGSTRVG
jgi:methylenetetrahydrofolate reductase (NADPH)